MFARAARQISRTVTLLEAALGEQRAAAAIEPMRRRVAVDRAASVHQSVRLNSSVAAVMATTEKTIR